MVGIGVEPPAQPGATTAAGLAARGVKPRRVTAKRSWPPRCGRIPAPPPAPAPAAAAGDAEKGGVFGGDLDGRADEAVVLVTRAAVSPVAQNGALPQLVPDKVEVAVATAAVSPAVQNGRPLQQGQNKMEEAVSAAIDADSSAACNGDPSRALPQPGQERVREEGGENEEAPLLGHAVMPSLDGQEGNRAVEMVAPAMAVPESCGIVGAGSSLQNGGEEAGLLVVEGGGVSGEVVREEVAGDEVDREMVNRAGGGELERKENGVEGSRTKRWLMSAMNPPPKRRAVSALLKFAPGCGRSAVTTTGSGDEEGLPLEATPVTNGDSLTTIPASGGSASLVLALGASNEKVEGKTMVDEGSSKAHSRTKESQVASDVVGTKQDNKQPQNVATKATPMNGFNEKMKGKFSPREGKQVARLVVDDKIKNKIEGSLQNGTLRTPLSDPIDARTKGKRLESGKMNVALLDNAEDVEGKMRSKTLNTKKEVVCSNVNTKQDKFARKLKGDDIGKDSLHRSVRLSKFGKHVATNQIKESDDMNLVPDQLIVQGLMDPDKCPWTQGRKSIVNASKPLPPRNMLKGKDGTPKKQLPEKMASYELIKDETIDDNEDSYLDYDGNSRALIVYEGKREMCVTIPPSAPSRSHHHADAQSKVRKLLQLFQAACQKLMQVEEQCLHNVGRIDLEAVNAIKKDPIYTKLGPIVGNIPGVEVGDEFHFRVELSIVGLHRPYQAGIDTSKVNGVPVAISIVASGGYPDKLSSSDELIYTGSGGKAAGKKETEDQKLERGNLALKNCIETKTPVRVIHGFKGQSRGEVGHSKGKQTSTFTYDGLYMVMDCWQEGPKGSMVFKYKLQRIPGQPELALHAVKVKATRRSKVREDLCLPDISQGSERIPICVINTIDDMRPAPFKYITKVIYPPWYEEEPPTGCDCTNGCSDSIKCACAVKNGGEIPFNFNGAIVEAKPLIYECGPSCRCPPTCHNRVSQHGVKIPLEIFKTGNTGWGVRSLSSISSGSFICEYAGELLQDIEAEKRENDEYLFDIGHNYHDEKLWEGLKSVLPGLQSSTPSSKTMEGFTTDAAECGNVGRFINHSCSPNLYAQNVLWDHDDMRMPHVMFFAIENIPPLQELTYHYNYTVGEVHDKNGDKKVKHCHCGSSECCGRLY